MFTDDPRTEESRELLRDAESENEEVEWFLDKCAAEREAEEN